MKYFDAHSHYTSKRFSRDRHELFAQMQREGVTHVVDCMGMESYRLGGSLAKQYDFYYICINDFDHYGGAYYNKPHFDLDKHAGRVEKLVDESVERLKKLCMGNNKIVGYGECWMDFRKTQKTAKSIEQANFWLSKDLEVAKRVGLPAVIHSGNADQESFDVIKNTEMPEYGFGKGMMHCYLGPPKMALDYIEMGYLISVTGLVTHRSPRGKNLVEVVKKVPLSHMVIETDCPYLTPEPFRDKRNDSGLLRLTVEAIAELKSITAQEVAETTHENAKRFYGIK